MIDIIDSCDSKVLCFRTHCLGQNAEGTTYVLVHILHRRTGGGGGGGGEGGRCYHQNCHHI